MCIILTTLGCADFVDRQMSLLMPWSHVLNTLVTSVIICHLRNDGIIQCFQCATGLCENMFIFHNKIGWLNSFSSISEIFQRLKN